MSIRNKITVGVAVIAIAVSLTSVAQSKLEANMPVNKAYNACLAKVSKYLDRVNVLFKKDSKKWGATMEFFETYHQSMLHDGQVCKNDKCDVYMPTGCQLLEIDPDGMLINKQFTNEKMSEATRLDMAIALLNKSEACGKKVETLIAGNGIICSFEKSKRFKYKTYQCEFKYGKCEKGQNCMLSFPDYKKYLTKADAEKQCKR